MVDWSCRCLLKLGFLIGFFFWGGGGGFVRKIVKMQSRSYTNLLELASGNFPVMGRERERRKMMSRVMTVPGSITELDDDQASSDPDFAYFVRVHFCDIVSKSSNTLVFNLYIYSDIAYGDLDLSTSWVTWMCLFIEILSQIRLMSRTL
ncbi:putative alpha,alpha-trehalose-phosphate synthase (UDP-forming) [Helianthus annuus]|nr:putative alpha,alpha-trehalose-phosphate synthase (UDP-forming) [Helianthus annuus]